MEDMEYFKTQRKEHCRLLSERELRLFEPDDGKLSPPVHKGLFNDLQTGNKK